MALVLYNTLSKEKRTFEPVDPQRVTMYVCGPTVYNYAHIGNARPVVVFDMLYRLLKRRYPHVVYARNFTDVDDKIIDAARAENLSIDAITQRFEQVYTEDMAALGTLPPDLTPRATENMAAMITMISGLIEGGHAYAAEGHVLFSVASDPDYGQLSRRTVQQLMAGARVDVAPYKKDPADFVLWKPSSDEQPGWESPWGRGRPGWHIECSAMILAHLGTTIDIHGGGIDLVFPHHENELAQSCCANQAPFVRWWMHNGFLTMDREKMSKSEGNVVTVNELLKNYPGELLRLALLSAHYRQPLDWSDQVLVQQRERLDKMYRALNTVEHIEAVASEPDHEVVTALEDDLNTPQALAALNSLVSQLSNATNEAQQAALKGQVLASGQLMGLLGCAPDDWLKAGQVGLEDNQIDALIRERQQARENRDFARADIIRQQLSDNGIVIEDGPQGTTWRAER
ncbi:MAG: cysteine--tRNA ligase [Lysobacterales bacterium]